MILLCLENHPIFPSKRWNRWSSFPSPMENVEKLYEFSPKMERLGRLIATQEYLKKESFEYNRVRLTSQERFINFIRNNGYLLQRVPQKYLASYLNMKPETFSRLKHLMKKPS